MSISISDSSVSHIRITSDVLDYRSTYTYCFWYRRNGSQANYDGISDIYLDGSNRDSTGTWDVTGAVFCANNSDGSGSIFDNTGTVLADDTWYHYAVVRTGTAIKVFINGVEDASAASNATWDSRGAATVLTLGTNILDHYAGASYYAFKAWTVDLSAAQLVAEKPFIDPVKVSDLYSYNTFDTTADVTDLSGNGNDFTNTLGTNGTNPPGVTFQTFGSSTSGGTLRAGLRRRKVRRGHR